MGVYDGLMDGCVYEWIYMPGWPDGCAWMDTCIYVDELLWV